MYPGKPATPPPDHESASLMGEEQKPQPGGKPGMKVESVTIRPSKNGGFIVTCSKTAENRGGPNEVGPSYESNDYVFQAWPEAQEYIAGELGVGQQAPAPGVSPGARRPMATALPPMDETEDDL